MIIQSKIQKSLLLTIKSILMKKITFLLLIILPFIGIGQNLAPNPTLDTAGSWSNLNAGTDQGHNATDTKTADGSGLWKIVSNGSFNSGIKSANVAQGDLTAGDYLFSYYVRGNAGEKTKAIIRDNGASANLNGDAYVIVANNTWELVEHTFQISATGTINLRAMVNSDVAGATVEVDEFSLTYIPPAGNTLTIDVVGAGSVSRTLDKISYEDTDNETLTATAATHWTFDNWSGNLTGSTNPGSILMDADKSVTANFTLDPTFNYAFNFDTDTDLEGWTMDPKVTIKSHTGGLVTLSLEADQWSRLNLFDFPIPATNSETDKYNKVTIVVKNEEPSTNQIGVALGPNNETSVFPLLSQAGFQTFEIKLAEFSDWSGDITSFRIRFADENNTVKTGRPSVSHDIVIDSVVFSFDAAAVLSTQDEALQSFSIYPNPANNSVNISSASTISKVQIFNISGKKVLETKALLNKTIDVSNLNKGIYFLKVHSTGNTTATQKLIIN
jgi:hypothetical protein